MWSFLECLRSPRRKEVQEEIRQHRGQFAHAVITSDRRADELREVLAGALRLREGHDRDADR
jgi:hypothetical protein